MRQNANGEGLDRRESLCSNQSKRPAFMPAFLIVEAEGLDPRPRNYLRVFYKLSSRKESKIVPDGLTRRYGEPLGASDPAI